MSGTPGRILDFIDNGRISLNFVETLVLDEADNLIDLGLQQTVMDVLLHRDCAPASNRQTLLFSATYPPQIRDMCQQYLSPSKPHVYLRVGNYTDKAGGGCAHILQLVKWVRNEEEKIHLLAEDIERYVLNAGKGDGTGTGGAIPDNGGHKGIVFSNKRAEATRLASALVQRGFKVLGVRVASA